MKIKKLKAIPEQTVAFRFTLSRGDAFTVKQALRHYHNCMHGSNYPIDGTFSGLLYQALEEATK